MKSSHLLLAVSFLCSSVLLAQSRDRDHQIVAEYSILNYALEQAAAIRDWTDSLSMSAAVQGLERIIKTRDFRYNIHVLYRREPHELVSIIDETNFQTDGFNSTIWAINKADRINRYYRLNGNNIEEFISKLISTKGVLSDRDRDGFIEMFNAVHFAKTTSGWKLVPMDSSNAEDFKDAGVRTKDLSRFHEIGKALCQDRVYSLANSERSIREVYFLRYTFDCGNFSVRETLLIRQRL